MYKRQYIYNLARNLDSDKYSLDYLVVGNTKSIFEKELNEFNGDGKNHFYYVPNIKKYVISGRNWLNNFYDTHRYDVIYMNTCTAARIVYCQYCIRKYKTPLIVHSHSGNAVSVINKFTNYLYKNRITNLSNVQLACSKVAYHWLFKGKCEETNIIPNGVDLNRFYFDLAWRQEIRESLKISADDVLIGNVGRCSAQKNQIYFCKIAKKLESNFKFLIIGDGELKESINQKINELGLNDRFRMISTKSDIEKYYSAMDIFVMPSNFEGLPIVGIEAQAEGLPCIFSNNISDQVALSAKCCFLNLKKVDEWANKIRFLAKKRYDGTELVKNSGFDNKSPVHMIEKIINSL